MLPIIVLVGLLPLIQASVAPPALIARQEDPTTTDLADPTTTPTIPVTPGEVTAPGDGADADATACTFTDAASVAKSKTSCSTITLNNIAVPAGTTLDLTGLNTGTKVIFKGTTSFGYKEWEGPLISVSGTNIGVSGAAGHIIDGSGDKWWDGQGSNGGKIKPKMFFAHSLKQSTITGLKVKNTPVQFMSINSATDLNIIDVTMDNSAGDGTNKGHNTDAFDVGSSKNVYISGAVVSNQDDCLAINSGTNITFTGGSCTGGHGLSIGSVGGRSDNVVKTVSITNSKITNSENGVRIKTVYKATGSVSNVTYADITLSNISKYGIVIQQDYENGKPTGNATNGVPITDLILSRVTGTVTSSATDIYILCGDGSCSKWKWDHVSVTGGKKSDKCDHVPSGVSC